MDQKLMLKTCATLVGIGLVLLLFFMTGRLIFSGKPAAENEVAAAPQTMPEATSAVAPGLVMITPTAATGNQVADKLRVAKAGVEKAVQSMSGATKKNHGGYVERAQAALKQTAADINEAIAFADEHPELSAMPGAAPAEAFAAVQHLKGLSLPKPNNQGHLEGGLTGLQNAVAALQEARGGNIGGNREKLIMDMDGAGTIIYDGFQYLQNGGKGATNGTGLVQADGTPGPATSQPAALP